MGFFFPILGISKEYFWILSKKYIHIYRKSCTFEEFLKETNIVIMADIQNEKKGGKGSIIIIVVLLVVIGALGYFLFNKQNENEQLANEKANTETELANKEAELASRVQELEELATQYETLKAENDALGITNEELDKKIASLKGQVNGLKSKKRLSDRENTQIKKQIALFKADLLKKDQEIRELKAENDSLLADKNDLINEKYAMGDSISNLNKTVAVASVLKAESLKITALYENGKEYDKDNYRARKVERFKLKFNISDNKVAKKNKKDICLKVIEPNGSVLFNLDEGSGSFMKNDGTNDMYTSHQLVEFDNSTQEVSFIYGKGSEYEKGIYKFELYGDGYFMGKTEVLLK